MASLFRTSSHKRKEVNTDSVSDGSQLRPGKLAKLFRCLSVDASDKSVIVPPKKNKSNRLFGKPKREKQYIVTRSDNTSLSSSAHQQDVALPVELGVDARSTSKRSHPHSEDVEQSWVASFDEDPRAKEQETNSSDGCGETSVGGALGVVPDKKKVDKHPLNTLWLWEHIEQLTERKAVAVARFQGSLAETDGLKVKLKEALEQNEKWEEETGELTDEERCLEFHKGTMEARCMRLETELKVLEKDSEEVKRVRQSQKVLLDEQMKQLMESQRTLLALREQTMIFGTEKDMAYKCMRDDLWGLHSMYTAITEDAKRQAREVNELDERLEMDNKQRGEQEQELAECMKRMQSERDKEKNLRELLGKATRELDTCKEQLDRRTQEAFDLQKWVAEVEVENAKIEAEAECSQGVESLIRGHVLPALRTLNEQMPAIERTMTALSLGDTMEFGSEFEELTKKNVAEHQQESLVNEDVSESQDQQLPNEDTENCPVEVASSLKGQQENALAESGVAVACVSSVEEGYSTGCDQVELPEHAVLHPSVKGNANS